MIPATLWASLISDPALSFPSGGLDIMEASSDSLWNSSWLRAALEGGAVVSGL